MNSSTWEIFLNFFTVATNDQFINLIHRFEWSTKATEAVDLSSLLERTLIEQGFADNETQAKEKYQRLFFYVFKLLTQTGLKRLTPDTRNNQLSLPPLSAQDRILLDNIIIKVSALEKRVDTIEFKTSDIALEVSLINNQVNHLSRIEKVNATVNYTLLKPILDVPPLVSHLSNRTNNINKLRDLISKHTWLFIYGGAGWGKTQLATLLIRAFNSCKGWIRLRRLSTQEACLCLDTAFSELFGEKPLGGWREWYLSFCNKFENATIIVIDDLPRISLGDGLSDRLLLLAQAFHSNGLCLLTTSSYNLPSGFQDILNNQILNTFECPPFDDLEATELFRAYNAPELFLANIKRITLLNSFAKQHPFVLNALSKYLDSRNWQFTMNEFQGVIKGEYISALTNDTITNILETVEDSQSRELLYRLNLILGDFSFKEVQSLASVKPVVERPLERLHSIIGLWVQQEVSERLLVSPLVAPLRSVPSLLPDTTMECHLVLGNLIVQKGQIDQFDALGAILHFCSAKAFNRAGLLLFGALNKLNSLESKVFQNIEFEALLCIWSSVPMPEQMDLGVRIIVRGLQIAVQNKLEKSNQFLVDDLDTLFNCASENESWALIGVTVLLNSFFIKYDFKRANYYSLKAIKLSLHSVMPDGIKFEMPSGMHLESLIWVNTMGINNSDDLWSWFNSLEEIHENQRQIVIDDNFAEMGCESVAIRLFLRESEKPTEEQRWHEVLKELDKLGERSISLRFDLLWAWSVSVKIATLSEYCDNIDGAVTLAEAAISQASDDPRIQFIIKSRMGRQYFNKKHNDKAVAWLLNALSEKTDSYPTEHMRSLLDLSAAIGPKDAQEAIKYARDAVSLAEAHEEISEIDLIKSLGELAIAHSLSGDMEAVFEPWEKAGERLLKCKDNKDDWKDLFVIYGHVSGYFCTLAHYGKPPEQIPGGEPYTAPRRGIFLSTHPGRADLYDSKKDCFIFAQLSMFAEALGEDEIAAKWALNGLEIAQTMNQIIDLGILYPEAFPHLVLSDWFADSLDFAIQAGAVMVVQKKYDHDLEGLVSGELDLVALMGERRGNLWKEAEYWSTILGLLPILFRIATSAINQPEKALSYAQEIILIVNQIETICADQELWENVSNLMDDIFIGKKGKDVLSVIGNKYNLENKTSLAVISLLGASLQDDITAEDAISLHLSIMPYICSMFKIKSIAYKRIILPFIKLYWETTFERMRFRFSSPMFIENCLIESKKLPEEQQAQSILKEIAYSLGMNPSSEIIKWLNMK